MEGVDLQPHREAAVRHLAGAEPGCETRAIPPVCFRVIPWRMRFSG